ncbi:MAG: sigma-54-dependent Fis family transcriptional regulator [Deltaproteobacteria bacterium]|nr:MAG: sigma-54-dependent Fis family transcriptional regulator [Deltaproteobacteria bacterium]
MNVSSLNYKSSAAEDTLNVVSKSQDIVQQITKSCEEIVVGNTTLMKELLDNVEKVAHSHAPTVLLQGESGTGKNSIARIIHQKSQRASHPFMEINCASLPETLIESELFGHERGAFTDAKQMKKGLFEMAEGGTLFLDEIAEMTLATQAKLLQAIEGKIFRRVGGTENLKTNVRLITATSVDLKKAVQEKKFREDLYYRLQLITLLVPPLRERIEDIPLLVNYFIHKFNESYKKQISGIRREAEDLMRRYNWPGNVRELKNVIERIAILENQTLIEPAHLPEEIVMSEYESTAPFSIPSGGVTIEEMERCYIREALRKSRGNQCQAARLLGMTRHTLRYRMEKFGMVSENFESHSN